MSGAAPTPAGELTQAFVRATTALAMIDGDGRIVLADPAMERSTGLTAVELIGRPFWEVYVIPEDIPRAHRRCPVPWPAAGPSWTRVTGSGRTAPGGGCPCRTAWSPTTPAVRHRDVAIDVTEQRRREALVQRKATTDALTGTWNRGVLFDALQEHLAAGTGGGCALLFCDVDDFKAVNDQHGHARGDQLLVEVAARLGEFAGQGGPVARPGGDEFVLLLPGVDELQLAALATRVRARMQEALQTGTGRLPVSVTVGSAHGRPGEDPDHVPALADRSMYSRKRRRTTRWTRTGAGSALSGVEGLPAGPAGASREPSEGSFSTSRRPSCPAPRPGSSSTG